MNSSLFTSNFGFVNMKNNNAEFDIRNFYYFLYQLFLNEYRMQNCRYTKNKYYYYYIF